MKHIDHNCPQCGQDLRLPPRVRVQVASAQTTILKAIETIERVLDRLRAISHA